MNRSSRASSNMIKFIVFSLLFIGIGLAICSLWSFIESLATDGIGDALAASGGGKVAPTVIIDPGHGGADGGAVGTNSVCEKDLNLDVALKLSDMLNAMGIRTLLTRDSDVMLSDEGASSHKNGDLSARRKIAESIDNAIFVSIHMNSFPIAKYSGTQVYYSANNEESSVLAKLIQDGVRASLQPSNTRRTKAATSSIYLLDKLTCPAILIECGFISNPEECTRLCNEEYRQELALSIACSLREYIYRQYP